MRYSTLIECSDVITIANSKPNTFLRMCAEESKCATCSAIRHLSLVNRKGENSSFSLKNKSSTLLSITPYTNIISYNNTVSQEAYERKIAISAYYEKHVLVCGLICS